MKYWLCGLMLMQVTLASAETPAEKKSWPTIREITFSGNDTTRDKTMLREMSVHVGDPADPVQIEHSRQAVQDLGLFKSVSVHQEPLDDGVRLVYVVSEKFYFLPYPRLSANVDRQYSYGAELEWNNVAGLNHNLRVVAARSDANRVGYGQQTSYSASYIAPFIADTQNNLSVSAGHSSTPLTDPVSNLGYTEIGYSAEVLLRHIYSTSAASQGWTAGTGLLYQHENRFGPGAPP
ncbi:MAG: POTRA domain-containing protein, partial [Rhodanobacter sp.]